VALGYWIWRPSAFSSFVRCALHREQCISRMRLPASCGRGCQPEVRQRWPARRQAAHRASLPASVRAVRNRFTPASWPLVSSRGILAAPPPSDTPAPQQSGGRVAPLIAAGTALLPRIAGPTVGNEANTRQAVTQVRLTTRSETVGGAILPPPAAGSGHALPGGALRQVGCRRPRLSHRRWLATP
jgi:hypothetical protein